MVIASLLGACGTEGSQAINQEDVELQGRAIAPITHNAVIESHTLPPSMAPGEVVTARITVRNTGASPLTDTWLSNGNFRITSTSNPASLWGWTRSIVASVVPVGGTYDFNVVISMPSTATSGSNFRARMQLLGSDGGFFGPELVVPIAITPGATRRWACSTNASAVPLTIAAGLSRTVQVTVRNDGTETWQPNSFCFRATDNPVDRWGANVCPALSSAVAPGETHTFSFSIAAPTTAGTYSFSRQMFAWDPSSPVGGLGLFDRSANCFSQSVQVLAAPVAQLSAAVVSHNVPAKLLPNTPFSIQVTIRNTGTEAWTRSSFYLHSRSAPRNLWGASYARLSGAVNPNETATFTLSLRAPVEGGTFNHIWQMRKTSNPGAAFFGETLSVPLTVECQPGYYLVSGACAPLTYAWDAPSFGACSGATAAYDYGAFGACSGGAGSWEYTSFGLCSASSACSGVGARTRSATRCGIVPGSGTETRGASCNWIASSGFQTRAVVCRDNLGRTVADAFCAGSRPPEVQNCTPSEVALCAGAPELTRSCTPSDAAACGSPVLAEPCSSPAGSRVCPVVDGTGLESCATGGTSWGPCVAVACMPGFSVQAGVCVSSSGSPGGGSFPGVGGDPDDSLGQPGQDFAVTYSANGADSGNVPAPTVRYAAGSTVGVLQNSQGLVRAGYDFIGWTTSTTGDGAAFIPGESFVVYGDVTLYASWAKSGRWFVNDDSQSGDRYTSAVGNDANSGSASAPLRTLARALALAGSGDVIVVDAGTYADGAVVISKLGRENLVLRGPNWDVSPVLGTRRPEATIIPAGAVPYNNARSNHVSIVENKVTIRGFSFTNQPGIENAGLIMSGTFQSHGSASDIMIERNRFYDLVGAAIAGFFVGAENWSINDNRIENIGHTTSLILGGHYRSGIKFIHLSRSANLSITNNFIRNVAGEGIAVGPGARVNISGNSVWNTGGSGIRISTGWTPESAPDYTVTNNTVALANTGNGQEGYGGLHFGQSGSPFWESVTMTGNSVWASSPAVLLPGVDIDLLGKNFLLSGNSFSGFEGPAVVHHGLGTLNASSNWFGGVCDPSLVAGSVNISPCLAAAPQ